jgi:hypothetical protein
MNQRQIITLLLSASVLSGCAGMKGRAPEYPIVVDASAAPSAPASTAISAPVQLAPVTPAAKPIAAAKAAPLTEPTLERTPIAVEDAPEKAVPAATAPVSVAPISTSQAKPIASTVPSLLDAAFTEGLTSCTTIANRPPVTLTPEDRAIAESGGALRLGSSLRVGAGQFDDQATSAVGPVTYRYVASYRGLPADLVQVSEGGVVSYILLNRHTGAQARLSDIPTPSPDGRYFATAVVKRFDFTGVEIIEQVGGAWAKSIQVSDAPAPCDLRWLSGDSLAVRVWNTGARRDAVVQSSNQTWTTTIR